MDDSLFVQSDDAVPLLAENAPVSMPDLPLRLIINTVLQYKALGDKTRTRILGIIQQQPATAKQIADRLKLAPGTVGHHLQALEAAGMAQVVARRLVHGIVAKYYTRTARLFVYESPQDEEFHDYSVSQEIITHIRDEVLVALADGQDTTLMRMGFPHARLTPERAAAFEQQLNNLIDAFVQEPSAPDGIVYGLGFAIFAAPHYLQVTDPTPVAPESEDS